MIEAYFDGCCEPINPGGTASYGAIVLVNSLPVWQASRLVEAPKGGTTSNNVAEYSGFIAVLHWFLDPTFAVDAKEPVVIRGDSNLVVMQIRGKWRVLGGHYVPFHYEARRLYKEVRAKYRSVTLEWIPREQNGLADELSKAVLDRAGVPFRLQPR